MADLNLNQIHKSFGALEIIKGIDLDIQSGEFVVFVGPSGCGKSTLLRMIAGLEDVSSGTLTIDGKDVTHAEPSERGIAMVFQSYALYPHMTVAENIGFGLSLAKRPKAEIAAKVQAAADTLQLTHLLERKPKALSGGQRQRVAIGRAIVRDPKVFLFDEPLSNLDASLRAQMRLELSELHARLKTTMVYVTHDQVEAMTMADRIVVLNGGRVEQVGTPMELYNHPATPFVAGFIGSPKMNLYTGPFAERLGCKTYGIRPEHIRVSEDSGDWRGQVRHVERLGADAILYLDVEEASSMMVRLAGDTQLRPGDTVWASPQDSAAHRFAA
ncbi:sn-glycerol-3-phosphate ABC transporter ATP-binding protein UgpC [Neorhizobium lilium]|uniref:sn-glycerol-3-phosphate ABC transporter ATP-binding protein UgpC n=1 Tax=Neorhizobium lilium TaxID=2503024 RepID=A0A3S3STW4_9HYPH|nr:sn-glycerol-3-phosphate ABC transporter ATP-binding protein UgpC [Neorhizobium lilium]RWX74691.1 sn-glycerol-3-phosphate ABC transporter ATP-binding protein UgpC [Neorhizobium lilium]